jgi:PLP dependent protein
MSVKENVSRIRDQIDSAARTAGRDPNSIAVMAVTKHVHPDDIRSAYEAGLKLFGESRVQEFSAKKDMLRDLRDVEWHMIGQLQSNKAAKAIQLFSSIDSLASLRLAERLNASLRLIDKKISVLIEINIAGESAKGGLAPNSPELEELLQSAVILDHLHIRGLMTVPPFAEDSQQTRPYFRKLRELRDRISGRRVPRVEMEILSMGMSHDFEAAIEEGSTCVRIGTAIFGTRKA